MYICIDTVQTHTVYINIYAEVKLSCIAYFFYLSDCDVIGCRPKVSYCNTFTEKKEKEKMSCCSQRFDACNVTRAVV